MAEKAVRPNREALIILFWLCVTHVRSPFHIPLHLIYNFPKCIKPSALSPLTVWASPMTLGRAECRINYGITASLGKSFLYLFMSKCVRNQPCVGLAENWARPGLRKALQKATVGGGLVITHLSCICVLFTRGSH